VLPCPDLLAFVHILLTKSASEQMLHSEKEKWIGEQLPNALNINKDRNYLPHLEHGESY
jgi:hypothetical protein